MPVGEWERQMELELELGSLSGWSMDWGSESVVPTRLAWSKA